MSYRFAAKLADLVEDEPLPVTIGDERIALYLLDGNVHATHNVCTHQFALLSDGYMEDGCIECPLHQGRFDIRTGAALCAPATTPVRVYDVRLEGDSIMVDL
ncbi:MAG: non-heme iron oxygenase ferredoxin subunit [Burkholderia sp.]|jgi:3-phenylpropionate/trans-cinnamate dioxygenase ferredoxin subunit|uniref:non-heme iron oxygenase ferredoxin subunit n=1 Tax=Burkholderia TaxID=32008 RepID=UPI00158E4AE3|nr:MULTISPECIES: non-heme iron oxygenase ferredoxin subunit [Burkholderia]MBY8604784.1 non-heme iron oxygenase ferredoxin subunit [Burkholderia arboris]MCA3776692.1 non-heme iron oxygenase ferredoxin subunit [Burkholderia sp.]MCA3787661.1 non-heme iron oxygenase ferredoxin subunit [Burkholderia sp.]MCA3795797.1 non-heme iron oxygenase ferredoxin subunit [Burkholderia sp.]MCA3800383.1 non-heme iron oxygenase ferredoxin subunit [Burkholderia sp.]